MECGLLSQRVTGNAQAHVKTEIAKSSDESPRKHMKTKIAKSSDEPPRKHVKTEIDELNDIRFDIATMNEALLSYIY